MIKISYEYTYDTDLFNPLTRYNISDMKGDGGIIDTLLGNILHYLKNNFGEVSLSEGNSVKPDFVLYFPYTSFDTLPIIAIDVSYANIFPYFIGGVCFVDDTNSPIPSIRGKVRVIFDIISRDNREKTALLGILQNVLYRGLYSNDLSKYGILNIDFVRSINRGMEQADKVLQFHTHQIISDYVFRHIIELSFEFIAVITSPSSVSDFSFIHSFSTSFEGSSSFSKSFTENSAYLELSFTYQ